MTDWSTLTDEELEQAVLDIGAEQERRNTLRSAPIYAAAQALAYLRARDGEINPEAPAEWVQPTGAHDAYPLDYPVTHNGKVWTSTIPNNTWEPGVSGWTEVVEGGGPAPWTQPTGAHDAYFRNPSGGQRGPRCTHNGHVWLTLIDSNVWEPTPENAALWLDEGPV